MRTAKIGPMALLLGTLAVAPTGAAEVDAGAQPSTPERIVLGTATEGGGFQLFGANLAAAVNEVDRGLGVDAIATRGSRQNLELLEAGEIDIGLVEGNAARQALDGIGRPVADLKVLAVMYPNPGMFVVRADSPYRAIDDLRGQPVAFGTRASGLRILVNDVLSGLGLSPEQDFEQIILDKAGDGPRMVLDGSAAALWGAGIGWPGFVRVADSDVGARFIPPSPQQVEQVLARHPHLRHMTVPAGTYRGQDADIDSIGLWSLILVRPDLPDATVYRLAAALHAAEAGLAGRLAQGRYTTAANTAEQVDPSRLHPGAAAYLSEKGLLHEAAR
jgi:TRAP transporter TAXI family solute receptor